MVMLVSLQGVMLVHLSRSWTVQDGQRTLTLLVIMIKLKSVFKHLVREEEETILERKGNLVSINVDVNRLKHLMKKGLERRKTKSKEREGQDLTILRLVEIKWFNRMY